MAKTSNHWYNPQTWGRFLPQVFSRRPELPQDLQLMTTLWPSFEHFPEFANDQRLAGIRLNPAMINNPQLKAELDILASFGPTVPLYFDVKGRQLRVEQVHPNQTHLDITLNHPIQLTDPASTRIPVLFKAGEDEAELAEISEDGYRLTFKDGRRYGPFNEVKIGESLHIKHPSLITAGTQFTDIELAKMDQVVQAGFKRYFLSYVESQRDVDEFLEIVGNDAFVYLKIESKRGLEYVVREFKKRPNLALVAACGDLYVEVDRPHHILDALKVVIQADPEACVGSRLMLSIVGDKTGQPKPYDIQAKTPDKSDWTDLAFLYGLGYRTMMLCDELCLRGPLLDVAVNALDSFRQDYVLADRPHS